MRENEQESGHNGAKAIYNRKSWETVMDGSGGGAEGRGTRGSARRSVRADLRRVWSWFLDLNPQVLSGEFGPDVVHK